MAKPVVSRKLIAVDSSELKVVRLVCRHEACAAIVELPVERLAAVGDGGTCPVCRRDLFPAATFEQGNPVSRLARAIQAVHFAQSKSPESVQIEFVLPDER